MKKLLYTTHADLSLPYFTDWNVEFYDSFDPNKVADLVYLRDPFNDPNYHPDPAKIDQLFFQHRGAYIVDRMTSYQDLHDAEDKLLQAGRLQELYPRTWLPSEHEFIPGKNLAKPRISQRAKDILFEIDGRELDDSWIIQELLDIKEELRVYAVNGEVIPQASVKSSKAHGTVKVIGARSLTEDELVFIQKALQYCNLDFVGFDLAILPQGQMKIIEANRSPQFKRFAENTGINLAGMIDIKR